MKFSSFLIFTAAGLAIAAPITPVSPSNLEKKLTVEPVEVVKRQVPSVSSLGGLTGALPGGLPTSGLPTKRQLGGLVPSGSSSDDGSEDAELEELEEPKLPKEPKAPSSVTDGTTEISNGADDSTSSATSALGGLPVGKRQVPSVSSLGGLTGGLPTSGLPTKRQLGGLIPSSSSSDDDSSETAEEPKEPKEPTEPKSVTDGVTEIDDGTEEEATSSATSALGGLPVGRRQLEGITEMLSPKPPTPSSPRLRPLPPTRRLLEKMPPRRRPKRKLPLRRKPQLRKKSPPKSPPSQASSAANSAA